MDALKDRADASKLPSTVREILQSQNPSLMCAIVDDAGKFLTKDEYIRHAKQVRANALKVLDGLPLEDLSKPVTGVPPFCKTAGDVFMFLGSHWLMHAGQWAIIRRSLGKPPLF